VLLLFLFLVI